jgi:hypothetical protein
MRVGGVTVLGAAKALKPMDSSAGSVMSAEELRRKWRRVFMGGSHTQPNDRFEQQKLVGTRLFEK